MTFSEKPLQLDFVRGDATGLEIPAHSEALRSAGATFLTEAFRCFGSLSPDNCVTRITRFESFGGGNSGHKLNLSVEFAHPAPGLHTDLFVKFSRDFSDAFRDRRRYELEAEVRLATLSRLPGFPINVPAAGFADFNHESGTGILITERIAFGCGGIEPLKQKCMDHELADPLSYYRATVTALARLIAAHKSGALAPQVDVLFPFDLEKAAAENPIPYGEQQLRVRLARYADFAAKCSRLLPANISDPQFIARLEKTAVCFLRHEKAIKRFLNTDRDFIALCHWNTNIDNAWFWRDATGVLQCGLLDWGMVRQMNVVTALWGGLCGASLDIWNKHLDELLALFIAELHARGGPQLDIAKLKLHLKLTVAMLGLSLLMEVPSLVLTRLPAAVGAHSPLDPVMHQNELARSFLHVFTAFLNLWQTQDFGAGLDEFVAWSEWVSDRDSLL
jgi:hypothetical protein